MVVVPALFAVIRPSGVTEAIDEDLAVYLAAVFDASGGAIVGLSW